MTNLLGSIRLAAYAFPLIAALVAVPFFDRQVRARCFNWVRTVFGGLFLFYVLCVLALVFFPLPDAAQAARLSGHEIQLVPFQFVADFLRETPLVLSDARTYLPALFDRTVLQVVCNILMLLPFGMYLRYVCGLDLGKVALASLAFSAFIELGQLTGLFFMFRGSYRLCDVDDLMLNTLGGPLGGYLADKAFKSVSKEQLLGQLACLVTIGIFLVLPGGTSGGLLVVLLLLVGIAMFLCKGTYFSIQPEMGIPTHISATAVAIATFVGYIPDMFVHTMFGNWIDAYGDAGYTKILFYGVGTAVLGVIAAVWAIAQAKKVAKRNAAAANAA